MAITDLLEALMKADPERLARAQQQGYDTSKVYFHGTGNDVANLEPSKRLGAFSSDDPALASNYASYYGDKGQPNVMPMFAKTGDARNINAEGRLLYQEMAKPRDQSVLFKNAWDPGIGNDASMKTNDLGFNESNIFATKDPTALRSIFANFDPAKTNSSDLLAGLGALGATGAGVAAMQPDEANALPIVKLEHPSILGGFTTAINNPMVEDLSSMANRQGDVSLIKGDGVDTHAFNPDMATPEQAAAALKLNDYNHDKINVANGTKYQAKKLGEYGIGGAATAAALSPDSSNASTGKPEAQQSWQDYIKTLGKSNYAANVGVGDLTDIERSPSGSDTDSSLLSKALTSANAPFRYLEAGANMIGAPEMAAVQDVVGKIYDRPLVNPTEGDQYGRD